MSKIKQLEIIQIIATVLVVIGHSFVYEDSPFLYKSIYVFHMPLFFIISGFLLAYTSNEKVPSIYSFIKKKTYRLIFPYIFISSIAFIPKVLLSSYALRPADFTFQSYFNSLIYPSENTIIFFWFLPTLYLISILYFLLMKIFNLLPTSIVTYKFEFIFFLSIGFYMIGSSCLFKLFNISGVLIYFFYFALGGLVYRYRDKLSTYIPRNLYIYLFLFGLNIYVVYTIDLTFDFIFRLISVIISSLFVFVIAKKFLVFHGDSLSFIANSTFFIYLFSWFPQVFVQSLLPKVLSINSFEIFIISSLCGFFVPLFFYFLVSSKTNIRNSFVKYFIGV